MIPVVERQMRTLTVGIGTLFDGNCGEKSFPEFFVRVRSGFREGKAFYFIRRKTGQIKGPVSGMHDGKLPVIIQFSEGSRSEKWGATRVSTLAFGEICETRIGKPEEIFAKRINSRNECASFVT